MNQSEQNNQSELCRHFGICGGCSSQNQTYQEQITTKEELVKSIFLQNIDLVLPLKKADRLYHYRNKMDFSFTDTLSGEQSLGLIPKKSRQALNLVECKLVNPWMIDILEYTRQWWKTTNLKAYFAPGNRGTLMSLTLREGLCSGEKMVVINVSDNTDLPISKEELTEYINSTRSLHNITTIILRKRFIERNKETVFSEEIIFGNGYIHEYLEYQDGSKLKFRLGANSFFQPNTSQANIIYQQILQLGDFKYSDRVLDLYCGVGSIGLFISKFVEQVVGIEIIEDAVSDAKFNFQLNDITNASFYCGNVPKVLAKEELGHFDVIITDPPRCGMQSKGVKEICKLNVSKIIYVSCNPKTQHEDCLELVANGYNIISIQPVDQFPHTNHLENIVVLQK